MGTLTLTVTPPTHPACGVAPARLGSRSAPRPWTHTCRTFQAMIEYCYKDEDEDKPCCSAFLHYNITAEDVRAAKLALWIPPFVVVVFHIISCPWCDLFMYKPFACYNHLRLLVINLNPLLSLTWWSKIMCVFLNVLCLFLPLLSFLFTFSFHTVHLVLFLCVSRFPLLTVTLGRPVLPRKPGQCMPLQYCPVNSTLHSLFSRRSPPCLLPPSVQPYTSRHAPLKLHIEDSLDFL